MRSVTFQLVRVTIELQTPFAVGCGEAADGIDHVFVTDANGLPTIPGTTIAGVLRHALAGGDDPRTTPRCRDLFGYQDRDEGSSSRVEISFAQVHDAHDRPVPMRMNEPFDDPVLRALAAGVRRDHVRIDERGVPDRRGKFDDLWVPAGARFTFELRIDEGSEEERDTLVALLGSGVLRIGRASRGGFGGFRVVAACGRGFDLRKAQDRDVYRRLPRALSQPVPVGLLRALPVEQASGSLPGGYQVIELDLEPEDLWIFGGGEPTLEAHLLQGGSDSEPKAADQLPVTEARIVWCEEARPPGRVEEHAVVVPGSAVKGALRHRVAFHARRLRAAFADRGDDKPLEEEPEVVALFGSIKGPHGGQAGCVVIDDLFLSSDELEHLWLDHVSIDRFTGGARDQRLFSEVVLAGARWRLRVRIDTTRLRDPTGFTLEALRCALDDLAQGRLALGAGASRGHGYFRGVVRGDWAWAKQ